MCAMFILQLGSVDTLSETTFSRWHGSLLLIIEGSLKEQESWRFCRQYFSKIHAAINVAT